MSVKTTTTRTLKVEGLTRVEGEGALDVKIRNGEVADVRFRIAEPPRLFEALLRGRKFSEAPDITARICGICPVAYQMSSVAAMEEALGIEVDPQIRALRRLLYCGEWIESHALHIYMLHAPDFLGYSGVLAMAKDHPETVKKALAQKKTGNAIVTLLGGREIHPVNVRVGGFYSVPPAAALRGLEPALEEALELALETVRWTASLPIPEHDDEYEFVALNAPDYPILGDRIVSNRGLDIAVRDYEQHFSETHVAHSNALHSTLNARGAYLVGPLARFNLHFDKLTPLAKKAAQDAGIVPPVRNPFRSIVVRAVETVFAVEEARRIVRAFTPPARAFNVPAAVRAGAGHGCSEAPRGILYHRYRIDDHGVIADAKIVPPTAQNQKTIENDLRRVVEENLELQNGALTARCETTIRNYDPCISCATHFLKLTVDRS